MMKNLRTSSLAAFGFAALLLTGACASTSNDDMTSASTADQTIAVQATGDIDNAENIGTNETSVPSVTGGITATGAPLDIEPGAVSTTVNTGNTSVDSTLSTSSGTTTQTQTTTVTTQGSMTSSSSADDDDDDDTATASRTRMRKD